MKKLKILTLILIILILILAPLTVLANEANEITDTFSLPPKLIEREGSFDTEGYITMPMMITNGTGKISVSSKVEGDYQLYYQAIELSDEKYNSIKSSIEEYNKFYEDKTEELETLEAEVKTLKEDYEAKKEIDPDSEETKTAYEAYQKAVEDYNTKVDEAIKKANEYLQNIEKLIPVYVENDWKATEDGTVEVDKDAKNFVLWAKLVTGEDTYYDVQMYSINDGNDGNDGNEDDNNNNNVENPGDNNQDDPTIADKGTLPKAGTNIIIASIATVTLLIIVGGYISYRKYKDMKNI